MKKSEIKFIVELDKENIPEKIEWHADDNAAQGLKESKAVTIGLWDQQNRNTLRIDLWTKDMPVDEMKKFYIDCIGGLAQSILTSTGDEYMASEMNDLCDRLVTHVREEN